MLFRSGIRHADGSLTFVAPKTKMIKSGVENIYPTEVEACIRRLPGVADAAIIGTPDPVWVQNVKAIVVLDAGADVSADDVIEHCRREMASYKKPKSVVFADALPRLGGLPDYDALDAAHGGGGYPGVQSGAAPKNRAV